MLYQQKKCNQKSKIHVNLKKVVIPMKALTMAETSHVFLISKVGFL